MATLTLSAQDAIAATYGDLEGYKKVYQEVIDEWRWGNVYQTVIQDVLTGKLWSIDYKEQSGDEYYISLQDEDEVDFEEVEAVEVTVVKYVPVKD